MLRYQENKKISLFLPSLSGGGAERVFVNLANEFTNRGLKVDLILAKKEGPYLKDISEKVNIIDLKARSVLFSLLPLAKYLRKERPNILLSSMEHANIISIIASTLARTKARVIVRTANTISLSIKQAKRGRALLSKYGAFFLYRFASGIIANSKGSADDLAKTLKISRDEITVLYNPLAIKYITEKAREDVNHKWLVNKQGIIILSAGRLRKHKDFSTLIRSFNVVLEKYKEAKLVIIGEGPDRKDFEKLIKKLNLEDTISLPGFVQNPYAYMSRADIFVLSSKWEGLPNVLLEAMACGTPVVSTDCPSGPAEILQNGIYGKLVPVGDYLALAEAIKKTIENPIDSQKLKERANDFSLEKIATDYLTFFLNKFYVWSCWRNFL